MKITKKTEGQMVLEDKPIWVYGVGAIFVIVGAIPLINPSLYAQKMPLFMSLIFIALGLAAIILVQMVTMTIDKGSNRLSIKRQNLLGTKDENYELGQIKSISLRHSTHIGSSSRSSRGSHHTHHHHTYDDYQLLFILDNEKEVLISSSSRSRGSINVSNAPSEEMIGKEISDFIKVPLKTYDSAAQMAPVQPAPQGNLSSVSQFGMEKVPLEKVEKPPAPESK